ncbi:MAG: hypothetical protein OXH15_08245 [Gammaproteobacteria bacterium]|nr:hypothetical protein [Gammaproteobacteria bacterium]
MLSADELTGRLARVVSGASFQTVVGPMSGAEVEALYEQGDSRWEFANGRTIDLEPRVLAHLVDGLAPLVADYTDERTARIGNGLCLASLPPPTSSVEVSLNSAFVTVEELARLLVVAATRITPTRVVDLLTGWLDGEPLRVRERALIRGVTVAGTPTSEGIAIAASSMRPPIVDHLLEDKPYDATDSEEAMCSVELEISPALFKPRPGEDIDQVRNRMVTTPRNGALGAVLSWDRLCESMALAIPAYVGWDASWAEFGELEAFTGHVTAASSVASDSAAWKSIRSLPAGWPRRSASARGETTYLT